VTNNRNDDTGKLCVDDKFQFGVVNTIVGKFLANGVIGLAPSGGSQSYINKLWEQGVIKDRMVGLNYEDPNDTDQISKVRFGTLDYNQVQDGADGLNFFTNVAVENTGWGLKMNTL